MNKKFLTILSLISLRGLITPILRKVIRTFFSDKTTNQIVVLISYIGGIIRIITALFGLVLFYNLIESFNFSDLLSVTGLVSAVTTFLLILRDNLVDALNKGFPSLDKTSILSKVIKYLKAIGSGNGGRIGIPEPINSMLDASVKSNIIHNVEEAERNFFSLRRLYNKHAGQLSWHTVSAPVEVADGYSWYTYLGIAVGVILVVGAGVALYCYMKTPDNVETIIAEPYTGEGPSFFRRFINWITGNKPVTAPDPGNMGEELPFYPELTTPERMKRFWDRIYGRYMSPNRFPDAPTIDPNIPSTPESTPSKMYSRIREFFRSPESPLAHKGKSRDTSMGGRSMYMDDSSSEGSSSSSIPDITLTTPRQSTMNLSSEGSTSSTPTQRTVNLSSSDLEGRTVSPDMKDYYSSYNVNVTTERAEMPDYSSVWR